MYYRFTMGDCTPEGEAESQFVLAYDLALCKKRWATRIGDPHKDGPRCTPTVDGGSVYAIGTDGVLLCAEKEMGAPACLDLSTGKIAWKAEPLGRGSAGILFADGHLIFRYDRGLLALVEATPEAFRLKGTFQPVIDKGRLYLRHGDLLLCYDVKAGG